MNRASRLRADPTTAAPAGSLAPAARNTAPAAGAIATENIEESLGEAEVTPEAVPTAGDSRQRFRAPSLLYAESRLVWLPMDEATLRPAWEVICTGRTHRFMY